MYLYRLKIDVVGDREDKINGNEKREIRTNLFFTAIIFFQRVKDQQNLASV